MTSQPEGMNAGQSRRLGRGLNALLGSNPGIGPEPSEPGAVGEANEIHVELIDRNPFQPRRSFDPESMQELVDSIKTHGLLQPILVRPVNDQYQLIAGERRLIAAKKAGLETVPCRVLHLEDRGVFEVAIEENLKREDLNVLDKAQAFQEYITRFNSTREELAKRLSLNRSTVSNMLRLLELTEPVKKALREDKITGGHARALLGLSENEQKNLCKKIQTDGLSVRDVEKETKQLKQEAGTIPFPAEDKPAAAPKPETSSHILSLQQQLQDALGVKVEIKPKDEQSGKIIIHFENTEEFERVVREVRKVA